MEKLENHIRKTLEKREIKPSSSAWERISSEVGQKKTRNPFFPLGVAASIIGLLILGLRFLLVDGTGIEEPTKENSPKAVVETETEKSVLNDEIELVGIESEKVEDNRMEFEDVKSSESNLVAISSKDSLEEGLENVQVNEQEFASLNKIEVSEEAINLSAQAILTEVLAMEKDTIQITDAEIDSLLLIAQKQLLAEQISQSNEKGEVDAMALLNEVELELLESERNQLFDRLRESFFKLRTAVADRNK